MEWVTLNPKAGLVIKSTTLSSGFYYNNPFEFEGPSSSVTNASQLQTNYTKIQIPPNRKIFINVAYASEIPPPLTDDEAVVQRALLGQIQEESEYFIPIFVGFGREDKDKSGNPSTVFDAFLNPAVKKRLTEDINYRNYVLEIILSTLESPLLSPFTSINGPSRSLSLSRTLATPNVRFKGRLVPRKVQKAELQMLSGPTLSSGSNPTTKSKVIETQKPLIEELSSNLNAPTIPLAKQQPLKSILKKTTVPEIEANNTDYDIDPHIKKPSDSKLTAPTWRWSIEKLGADAVVKITIDVPNMTRSIHSQSKLSLSADIITLRTPQYFLQIFLNNQGVKIPLNHVVDIDKARAEWRIEENVLVTYLPCILVT
ncbi:hypothetical protein Clacol_003569 [Clathrus columnatus]|uniref:PIH1 N-terminal domain-containing protein n=1 Tax=Clathrus columnatus TaxID=1419009 RepID=A0AAV5A431_9AGAM|nr:hypothetical protein Clacol_003569 [Clathrus columnatus]